jgi:hypothetical protein
MNLEDDLLGREILWLLVILLLLMLFLPGCAAVPECPPTRALVLETDEGGVLYAFDSAGLTMWYATVKAEARGDCRWPPKGDPA